MENLLNPNFTNETELFKYFSKNDIVMTRHPSTRPWDTKKHTKRFLLLRVKKVTLGLLSDSLSHPNAIVWFEGPHAPLFQKDLILIKRNNILISDLGNIKPVAC